MPKNPDFNKTDFVKAKIAKWARELEMEIGTEAAMGFLLRLVSEKKAESVTARVIDKHGSTVAEYPLQRVGVGDYRAVGPTWRGGASLPPVDDMGKIMHRLMGE